ncbi:MAG: hypothetical protein IJ058_13910 [Lachnospiraceae bacterium]|nr:hypothetical protein [Lachnospiraceae bacterium]MBQ8947875.1 hypothetical protein [Lachnospiraceae bacterium]
MNMTKQSKYRLLALALSCAVAAVYMYDFFFMVGEHGVSGSDVKTQIGYIESWWENGSLPPMCQVYPLYYYIINAMFHVLHYWTPVILVFAGVWSFVTNLVQIDFVRHLCGDNSGLYPVLTGTALSFAWPVSLQYSFFGGVAFWEMPMEQVFLTSGATSPNHSLTFLCVKPFALLSIYLFLRILDHEEAQGQRELMLLLVAFSGALFLSVIAKPNFYQAFAPAGAVATVTYFVKKGRRSFGRCISMAAAYLPATFWVLYGMTKKLNTFAISPLEGIRLFGNDTPLWIVLARAIVFCIFVTACLLAYHKADDRLLLGWLVYAFGTAEFLLLIEPDDILTLSMSWGYYIGQYVLFAVTAGGFRQLCMNVRNRTMAILSRTGCLLLAVHAAFGLLVFLVTWWPWWRSFLGI